MVKQHLFLLLILTLPIYGTGQICLDLPPINGLPTIEVAPEGWTVWNPSPDIIAGEGPWPGGSYVAYNVEGTSPGGGEMTLLLGHVVDEPYFEGIETILTELIIGETYSISIGWQQVILDNEVTTYREGKLSLTIDGVETIFTSNGDVTDEWQIATIEFVATGTTGLFRCQVYWDEATSPYVGLAIVVDDVPCGTDIFEPIAFTDINIFSPNNDGINDVFSFDFRAASIATFSCVIVNRWGTIIYEMDEITDFWDGTTQAGEACSDGVYFYTYRATTDNGTVLNGQGTVQLVK